MPETTVQLYFQDVKSRAVFGSEGPKPQFLFDEPGLKVLVAGLEASGQIPVHPEAASMYYFLEGEGLMTVGEETFSVRPGVTVIVPGGERRGLNARTRLVFLAAKGGE